MTAIRRRRRRLSVAAAAVLCIQIQAVPLGFGFGARYYATAPDGGPDWGLRLLATFLFPR